MVTVVNEIRLYLNRRHVVIFVRIERMLIVLNGTWLNIHLQHERMVIAGIPNDPKMIKIEMNPMLNYIIRTNLGSPEEFS
jgi:hypothetical protein